MDGWMDGFARQACVMVLLCLARMANCVVSFGTRDGRVMRLR